MYQKEDGVIAKVTGLLQQDYRGVNIAVYAVAAAALAVSVHKIRPVSKFSKASKVPDHFIRKHEPLRGIYSGVQHSPVRVLVNHRAPIYLPLWHSSKPPLPVKLWGVDIVSGNAVSWLDCVASGKQVTLKPIGRDKNDLVSNVILHLPETKKKNVEFLDIGQKLVELGFAKASVPKNLQKNTLESKLAPAIVSAEAHAKRLRNGIWSDILPPLPAYIIYGRKMSQISKKILVFTARRMVDISIFVSKSALIGIKNLALKPFRSSRKRVHAT